MARELQKQLHIEAEDTSAVCTFRLVTGTLAPSVGFGTKNSSKESGERCFPLTGGVQIRGDSPIKNLGEDWPKTGTLDASPCLLRPFPLRRLFRLLELPRE